MGVVLPPHFRDALQIGNPQVFLSCTEVEFLRWAASISSVGVVYWYHSTICISNMGGDLILVSFNYLYL